MRPIARPPVAGWQRPASLDFARSRSAGVVNRVFGTSQPATDDCLALWDDKASGARSLNPDEEAVLGLVQARVAECYRKAMPDVIDGMGAYCAYCELPLHDPSQLEHVLPKSQYPTFALDWDNFLPACVGCNSRKGDQPLRATVAGWLGVQQATPPECEGEVRGGRFRWPDRDVIEGYVAVHLHYHDGTGWQPCDPQASVDAATRHHSTSIRAGEVRATVPGLPVGGAGTVPVAALVVEAASDSATRRVIDLCKLARTPIPGDASDRRTVRRTEVWLQAVQALRAVVGPGGGLPAALPASVADQVRATGFWRVWVMVAGLVDTQLRQLLVAGVPLPGTDASRVP